MHMHTQDGKNFLEGNLESSISFHTLENVFPLRSGLSHWKLFLAEFLALFPVFLFPFFFFFISFFFFFSSSLVNFHHCEIRPNLTSSNPRLCINFAFLLCPFIVNINSKTVNHVPNEHNLKVVTLWV